jgi:hypothetical protein
MGLVIMNAHEPSLLAWAYVQACLDPDAAIPDRGIVDTNVAAIQTHRPASRLDLTRALQRRKSEDRRARLLLELPATEAFTIARHGAPHGYAMAKPSLTKTSSPL